MAQSRSNSPMRNIVDAAFLNVPASNPLSIRQSGTLTPNQSAISQPYIVEQNNIQHTPRYAPSIEIAECGGEVSSVDVNHVNVDDDTTPLLVAPTPLIRRQEKPTPSCTANFVNSIGSNIYHVATHPISSSLALVTAAPTALNALAAPSGMGPDKLGNEWWNSMSGLTRAHSIANGVSSLLINTIMNALFLPTAWQKFRDGMIHFFDSWGDVGENFGSIVLAIGGAFAAAVIAYNAFLWLPAGVFSAIIPAALAFVITMAQRYVGVKNVIRRIRNYFNEDARTQLELADIAQHINPAYLEAIEARFKVEFTKLLAVRASDKPLTDSEHEQLLIKFSDILSDMQKAHPDDLIKGTSTLEYITRYTGTLFDMAFAILVIAPPSLLTHMQKGFDGINTISKLTTHHSLPLWDNVTLDTMTKCAIGAIPGLASAMLYANSALDIRTILVDLTKHLYQNPRNIPFAITLLIANGFASGGMQNVAMGVVANPDNLAHLKPGTPLAKTYEILQALGGGVVNSASIKKAFLSAQTAAPDVIQYVANYAAGTNERVISHATGLRLRNHSLFTTRRAPEAAAKEEYRHQPTVTAFV